MTNPTNRLGTTPAKPVAAAPNPFNRPQPPQQNALPRFGNRVSINWTIQPSYHVAVRFDLRGLGDPFHRLLQTELDLNLSQIANVGQVLLSDSQICADLTQVLEKAWKSYDLRGACLLYPATDAVKKAYVQPPLPQAISPTKQDGDDEETEGKQQPTVPFTKATCLRAIDIALVMNVLFRTRAHIVAQDTPLAMEPGFLDQSLICDDPRLVKLALATGTLEEVWG